MKTLSLKFLTKSGKPVTMNIPNCSDMLDEKKIKEAAQVIISKNIFLTKNGELAALESAKVIETETQKFDQI